MKASKSILLSSLLFSAAGVTACGNDAPPPPAPTGAQEGAHVHGFGDLGLSLDGDTVTVSLFAPKGNFKTIDGEAPEPLHLLEASFSRDPIVRFNDAAGCELTGQATIIETVIGEDEDHENDHADEAEHEEHAGADDHDDETEHDSHDDEEAHADHHDKSHGAESDHAEHHVEESHDHDAEDHEEDENNQTNSHQAAAEDHEEHDHDSHSGHSDFEVTQTFVCTTPEKIEAIETTVFEAFGGFETVKLSYVTESSEDFGTLTAESPKIDLK